MRNLVWFQFSEESDSKNGDQKSNITVQIEAPSIEDDGPSETFKDEESKVKSRFIYLFICLYIDINCVSESILTKSRAFFLLINQSNQCNTPDDEAGKPNKEETFKNRLRKELVSRDGHGYEYSMLQSMKNHSKILLLVFIFYLIGLSRLT